MISSSGFSDDAARSSSILVERLAAYLPPLALPDPLRAPATYQGAVLYAEIEGFSPLAESLIKTGREGADVLTRLLNSYFGPAGQTIDQGGGQLLHFDGRTLLAFFPAELDQAPARAVRTAETLLKANESFRPIQTADGRYSFQIRVGLASGKIELLKLGSDMLGRALVFNGPPLEQARLASNQARWGEWLPWGGSDFPRPDPAQTFPVEARPGLPAIFGNEDALSVYNRLAVYLPRLIAQRLKTTPEAPLGGEFRRVVSIFVHLSDLDLNLPADCEALQDYYLSIQRVCAGLDGRVHSIAPLPSEQAARLHLTFGALLSNNDDASHALQAALTVRDLPTPSGVPPTLGVASGNVYTGSIGYAHRQKYMVLGDVVTLGARFAEAAASEGAGTLLVDRYTRERVGLSYLFGEDIILTLQSWPFPVKASRLLARRPEACNLAAFVREYAPGGSLPTATLGTLEQVMASERRVLVLHDEGQASHLAQRWLKRGGNGAAGLCMHNAADVPYLAWGGLLGGLVGLNDTDSRTEKAAKIAQSVARFAPEYTPLTGWFNQLVGLAQEEPGFRQRLSGPQREQFARMVTNLLHGMADTRPLMLVFKDLQWSDEASIRMLEEIVRDLEHNPILFCLVIQPDNSEIRSRLTALPGVIV